MKSDKECSTSQSVKKILQENTIRPCPHHRSHVKHILMLNSFRRWGKFSSLSHLKCLTSTRRHQMERFIQQHLEVRQIPFEIYHQYYRYIYRVIWENVWERAVWWATRKQGIGIRKWKQNEVSCQLERVAVKFQHILHSIHFEKHRSDRFYHFFFHTNKWKNNTRKNLAKNTTLRLIR